MGSFRVINSFEGFRARQLEIKTKSGILRTPAFLPVMNPDEGVWKIFKRQRWWRETCEAFMVSAHSLLSGRVRREFEAGVDVHDFFRFHKPIFIDSGGFSNVNYMQEEVLRFQERINCDIAATLDYPLFHCLSAREKRLRLDKTLENIGVAIDLRKDKHMLLYGCVHGESEKEVASFMNELERRGYLEELDGLAIGSFAYRKTNLSLLLKILRIIRKRTDKPVHIFGISDFRAIPLLIMEGCDSFDSKTYAHAARFREWIDPISLRRRHISSLERKRCGCRACRKYSLGDYQAPGIEGACRIAEHNLNVYINFARKAIHSFRPSIVANSLKLPNQLSC